MAGLIPHQYKIIGMQKDNSASAFDSKYSFDNKNIRITSVGDNTQMSIINERGTQLLNIINITNPNYYIKVNLPYPEILPLEGTPIGYNVIDDELIVFTTENDGSEDIDVNNNVIYKLSRLTATLNGTSLSINYKIDNVLNEDPIITANLFIEVITHEFVRNNNAKIKVLPVKHVIKSNVLKGSSGILTQELSPNYEFVTINKVAVFYQSPSGEMPKLLYSNYINKLFKKDITKTQIISSLDVLNINFPYYINKTKEFIDSIPLTYTVGKTFEVINGVDNSYSIYTYATPLTNYTTNHYFYNYDESAETFVVSDFGLAPITYIPNYGIVMFYMRKLIPMDFTSNYISDISITDFPSNVNVGQVYTFHAVLSFNGIVALINKELNVSFNKNFIDVLSKTYSIMTKTWKIQFKAHTMVSNGSTIAYVISNKYPERNKVINFNIQNPFINVHVASNFKPTIDVVLDLSKDLTENTFTVDNTRPYEITTNDGWLNYTLQEDNTTYLIGTNESSTTYRVGSIKIQYTDIETEEYTEIVVEQIVNNTITSKSLNINNSANIPTQLLLDQIFTVEVYALPTKTYSSPIIATPSDESIKILQIKKNLKMINNVEVILNTFIFQVTKFVPGTNSINFNAGAITSVPVEFTIKNPVTGITLLQESDLSIVLKETFSISAYATPTDASKTKLILLGDKLGTILSNKGENGETVFSTTVTEVPEQQVLTVYSKDDPSIFKSISYQIEEPYIQTYSNNGDILDSTVKEIVFKADGTVDSLITENDVIIPSKKITGMNVITNCSCKLEVDGESDWFDLLKNGKSLLRTLLLGEYLNYNFKVEVNSGVQRTTTLKISASNHAIERTLIITQN